LSHCRLQFVHNTVEKQELERQKLLELKLANDVNNSIMNEVVIDDFEKQIEYYHSFTSSVMNCNKPIECIKLSKYVKFKLNM